MKIFILVLSLIVYVGCVDAQRIRVNGEVTTKLELPIEGVLVMAFVDGDMIKSYVTDDKGEYSFFVDKSVFDVLFYKPGMYSHTCKINNRMEKEIQGINLNVYLDDSTAETAVDLPLWLKKHHLTASYMDSIYTQEIKKSATPKEKHKSRKQIEKDALAEQKRFANYKENTVKDSVDNNVTTVVIGPDTYERITSDKGSKQYFKNQKPITEATYRFETTRRYDGVLKSSKNVKQFDKYKPMQHVKG